MVRKVKCNDEVKDLSIELQKELVKLKNLLSKLETNIGLLQDGSYWNGTNAYDVNKSLIGNFDHNKALLSKLEKCSETLESVSK